MNESRIPNAESALIDRRKLSEYLLARSHPVGRGKARFFERLGFSADETDALEAALRTLVLNPAAVSQEDTGFGTTYIADGQLHGAGGAAFVRTVWIVNAVAETP